MMSDKIAVIGLGYVGLPAPWQSWRLCHFLSVQKAEHIFSHRFEPAGRRRPTAACAALQISASWGAKRLAKIVPAEKFLPPLTVARIWGRWTAEAPVRG